jgi:hypothetical protein
VPLTQGVIDPAILNFTRQDLLPNGAANPDSPNVKKATQGSVLNTSKDFAVYRKDASVGQFAVTSVSVVGSGQYKVAGKGIAKGFEPQFDLAVAGSKTQGKFSCPGLTPAQLRQARSLALGLIPRTMPRMGSWPETEGQAIILSNPESESLTCFDLSHDGTTEVSVEMRIPFKSPKGKANQYGNAPQLSAGVFLFGRYEKNAAQLKTLLSSFNISGEGSAETYPDLSGSTRLMGVADIAGDGNVELVVGNVGGAADNWIKVYKVVPSGLLLLAETHKYWTIADY